MIRVSRGELCHLAVEGVVRPVGADGVAVAASGRRLEAEAGPTVTSRIEGLGELPVGGAVITPAGNLSASFVIHVVVQSRREPFTSTNLRRALVNGLRRAAEWGVETLALPPIGLGPGTMDPDEAARALVDVLREHLRTGEEPRQLTIAVETDYEEELYLRLVAATERSNGGR